MSAGLLEVREDSRSPRADSKNPGGDGERNEANKIEDGKLRKEHSECARGWGTSTRYRRIQGGNKGWRSKG